MNKKTLSESDICDKFIRPAMERAGWNGMDQIYSQYPLRAGRMVVRGRQARRDATTVLRADYALFHKVNIPLAVIEAKDNSYAMGAGMAQAINYGQLLQVPFCFSSNDDSYYRRLVLDYLDRYGRAARSDLDALLLSKLPNVLDAQQKANKVKNLLQGMRRAKLVHPLGPRSTAVWNLGPDPAQQPLD